MDILNETAWIPIGNVLPVGQQLSIQLLRLPLEGFINGVYPLMEARV